MGHGREVSDHHWTCTESLRCSTKMGRDTVLRSAIRWLLRIPAPAISAADALEIARHEAERRGWHRWERQRVQEGIRGYGVTFGEVSPGASWWWMKIAGDDGRIVESGIAHEWRNPDPSGWAFSLEEVSAGVWRVVGTNQDGRSVERTGSDLEATLADCEAAALQLPQLANTDSS